MKTFLPLFTRLCGALVLASVSVACGGVGGNSDAPAAGNPVAPIEKPRAPVNASGPTSAPRDLLMAEIGDAACDSSQQCKTVPIGSKGCGGPEGYLAYSTKRGDSAKIVRLAAEDTAKAKQQDQRSGMVSNCMMMMDPGAVCSAGRCITAPAGAVAR